MCNEQVMNSIARRLEQAEGLLRKTGNTKQARIMVKEAYEVLDVAVDQSLDAPYPSARTESTGIHTGSLEDGRKWVEVPFYPEAVSHLRDARGQWDHDLGKWVFPNAVEWSEIESVVRRLYGTALPEDMVVDIEIPVSVDDPEPFRQSVGRVLVERRRIGNQIVLGRNVSVVSGGFDPLPEDQRPQLLVQTGTVLKVCSVPLALAELEVEKTPEARIL